MTELRAIFKDLLSIGVLFIFLYNVVWAFALALYVDVRPGLMVLLAPFVLMYVVRKLTKKGYMFLLLSGVLCLVSWFFLRFLEADGAVVFFLGVSLVYSIYAWMNSELEPSFASNVIFLMFHVFLFFMLAGTDDASTYQARIAFSYLVLVCFTVLYRQMDSLDYKVYLLKNADGHTLSTKRLVRTNNTMGLAFAGLVLVAGFLSIFFPLHLIGRFFTWLASLFAGRFVNPIPMDEALGHIFIPEQEEAEWVAEVIEDSGTTGFGIISTIIEVLVWSVVAAIIFMLLYAIARRVKTRKKSEKFTDSQEEVRLAGSLIDDLLDLLPRFKKARHPIRRVYEKKVNSHIKQGILIENHDTTDTIADKIRDSEDIDELTSKYETVRYGREV